MDKKEYKKKIRLQNLLEKMNRKVIKVPSRIKTYTFKDTTSQDVLFNCLFLSIYVVAYHHCSVIKVSGL